MFDADVVKHLQEQRGAGESSGPALPTVHLNGTALEDLLSRAARGQRAVRAAVEAVAETAPHMRDFYVQAEAAGGRAAAEHAKRMEALRSVERDLDELVRHLRRQARERAERRAERSERRGGEEVGIAR